MKPRYILYARVSSEKQSENTSIQSQIDEMYAYCERMGYEVRAEFSETKSGTGSEARPEFEKALALLNMALNEPPIAGLIVYDLDRFFRNAAAGLTCYQIHFESREKQLISICQNFETNSPEGYLVFGMFLLYAEYSNKQHQARMRRGYNAAKAKDPEKYMGGKLGYGQALEDGKVVEVESPVLDFVRFGISNGWSVARITQELNWRGYKPLHGLKFYRSTVSAVVGRIQRGENVVCTNVL